MYFIFSLFPKNDSRETLESLKSANKLCTSLKALEVLTFLTLGTGKQNIVRDQWAHRVFVSRKFCVGEKINYNDAARDSSNSA